jgi:hypothetical protein
VQRRGKGRVQEEEMVEKRRKENSNCQKIVSFFAVAVESLREERKRS